MSERDSEQHDADLRAVGAAYLEHLTADDQRLLVRVAARSPEGTGALHRSPALVPQLLADAPVLDEVLGTPPGEGPAGAPAPVTPELVSPFLVFAAAVERSHAQLGRATYVREWFGPRQRVPVLGATDLQAFLADPWHRLFLAELLGSYVRVASGAVVVKTRRGLRRQRFSELDPVRMAALLDVTPEPERPGIYRRLGDLALFLTGVFPDHTARHGLAPIEESRLPRTVPRASGAASPPPPSPRSPVDPGAVALFEELGRRWYRLAYEGVPHPRPRAIRLVGDLAGSFSGARRALNLISDDYLFPVRDQWFGSPLS